MIICSRSECQTTAGCQHHGPHGEMCWFGSAPPALDPHAMTIPQLQAEIARLQAILHFKVCGDPHV